MTLSPGTMLLHYRIEEMLGEGGMGAVYRAHDLRLGRAVAIKFLAGPQEPSLASSDRLLREARAAATLNHPHIVTIYAVEETGGTAFLAMELVDGETLEERLRSEPLPVDSVLRLGIEVSDALEEAHRAGVIHRDIKPSNILITPRGSAKVLDFGVATWGERSAPIDGGGRRPTGDPAATQTIAEAVGTAPYMSPEQTRGETLDGRSDIFALGCVLYEAATGRRAFQGVDFPSLFRAIQQVDPPNARSIRPELPPALDSLLSRAMAKRREERFSGAGDLAAAFREIRERGAAGAGNLPGSVTSFVGREREIDEIAARLRTSRSLTLTGAGGCGKTRLALEVASRVRPTLEGGAWLIELAALGDPALVVQAVATALGVREQPNRPLLESVLAALGSREVLLVLDNCEHLKAACARLAGRVLEACPGVRLLATSREPVGFPGEDVHRVPSLTVPPPGSSQGMKDLLHFESARLFVERARALGSGFELGSANAATVAQICRRLDGIPLALELAAARVRALPVGQVLSRLEDCFRILSAGIQEDIPRHRTLRATVDWSYAMLDDAERILFDRSSAFSGGFSLESAEAVCGFEPIAEADVLDGLTHLADKSLIVPEEGPGGDARYRLLEPLRQYGNERLRDRGEGKVLHARHAEHFAALAERAEPELEGPDQATWLERVQADHDNLRQAIRVSVDSRTPEWGLRVGGSIWRFWWVRGYVGEGRNHLNAVLGLPGGEAPTSVRARALVGAGRMCYELGLFPEARARHEEALAIRRALGDRAGEAMSLVNLGIVAHGMMDHEPARRFYEASMAIHDTLGNRRGVAICLNNLARLAYELGDLEDGARLFAQSLELRQALQDRRGMSISLNGLGMVALHRGDLPAARDFHTRSLSIQRELGDRPSAAESLLSLGAVAATAGDAALARGLIEEGLTLQRQVGDGLSMVNAIEACLVLATAERQWERVLRLEGLGRAYRATTHFPRIPVDEARIGAFVGAAEREVGPERAREVLTEGAALDVRGALAEAVGP